MLTNVTALYISKEDNPPQSFTRGWAILLMAIRSPPDKTQSGKVCDYVSEWPARPHSLAGRDMAICGGQAPSQLVPL